GSILSGIKDFKDRNHDKRKDLIKGCCAEKDEFLSHSSNNYANSDIYGNTFITKDGNMSIKEVRLLLKEIDICMDIDNYVQLSEE
ncbi:7004_t:CDS:2, partial [Entrophospora sp. SA101]